METQNRELHRVVATAIIYRDGKYLIVQRNPNRKFFPGKWTIPGGGLEIDDYINLPKTTEDAWYFPLTNSLKREIQEETGLDVGKIQYLLDLVFIRTDSIPVITLSFYCPWKKGEVKLNEENVDYKWVTFEEARSYDIIDGILEEIEMVDRILKGENPNEVEYSRIKT